MIIYQITNKINGKSYIGCTKHTLKRRWQQHVSSSKCNPIHHFHKAIAKYGVKSWDMKVIHEALSENDMLDMERKYIKLYNTYQNGYNSSSGGEQSLAMTGSSNPMYGKKRDLHGDKNPMFGKSHSESTKMKISKSHAGHSRKWGNHTDETKSILSERMKSSKKSCKINYLDGREVLYESLKDLSVGENIDYSRVKQVVRSKSNYSRKHKCFITS